MNQQLDVAISFVLMSLLCAVPISLFVWSLVQFAKKKVKRS